MTDELLPLYAAVSLLDHADLDIPVSDIFHPQFFVASPGGRYYPKFGPGQSLILTPLAAVGNAFGSAKDSAGERGEKIMQAALFFGPLAVSAIGVLAFWMWLNLGYSARISAMSSIVLMATSELLPYSRSLFGNLSCALLLFGAFFAIGTLSADSRFRAAAGGFLLGLSVLVRPDTVLFLASFTLYLFLVWKRGAFPAAERPTSLSHSALGRPWPAESQARQVIWALIPFSLCAAGLLLFNRHAYGSFFSTGYKSEMFRFGQPFLAGAWHILFSLEKGFFVYSPSVLASIFFWRKFHRAHPGESMAALLFVLLSIYIYAGWYASSPGNDLSYGQRFLLPALPFAYLALPECLLAVRGSFLGILSSGLLFLASGAAQIIGCLQRAGEYRRWAGQFEETPSRFAGYLQLSLNDPSSIQIWWVQSGGAAVLLGLILAALSCFFACQALYRQDN